MKKNQSEIPSDESDPVHIQHFTIYSIFVPKNEGKKRTLLLHFFHMNLVFLLEKNSFTWGLAMGQTPATDNKKTCDTGEGFCPPQPNLHWAILFSTRKKGKFPSILIKVSPSRVEIQMCFLPFSPEFPTNFPISGEKGARPSVWMRFFCVRASDGQPEGVWSNSECLISFFSRFNFPEFVWPNWKSSCPKGCVSKINWWPPPPVGGANRIVVAVCTRFDYFPIWPV